MLNKVTPSTKKVLRCYNYISHRHRDGIRLRPSRRAAMTLSHDGTVQFCLANVTARDAGVYNCTATNAVGHTETSTRVAIITDAMIQDQFFADGSANVASASPDIP